MNSNGKNLSHVVGVGNPSHPANFPDTEPEPEPEQCQVCGAECPAEEMIVVRFNKHKPELHCPECVAYGLGFGDSIFVPDPETGGYIEFDHPMVLVVNQRKKLLTERSAV